MNPRASMALLLLVGCAADRDEPPLNQPPSCPAGAWLEDGRCLPAGLSPDMPCPPAEQLREDGTCIPAGVPPDGCGEGFVHQDRGCEPVLPTEPCPPGLMAVPGETSCREVAPCAPGRWGDIPVEPSTEYVDARYPGVDSDGSALKPWVSIQAAVNAAAPGAIIAIAEGSYLEDVTVSGKPVALWGVCPRLVEVVGTGAAFGAVQVFAGAQGTAVRSVAIRGDGIGFITSGSLDIRLERIWVHDANRGLNVEDAYGPTSVTLQSSLVEQNRDVGVHVTSSEMIVDASVVRSTELVAPEASGRGVNAQAHPTTGAPAKLLLRSSLVENNVEIGVAVSGSEATVEASVVRDTQPNQAGFFGRGVSAHTHTPTNAPSTLVVQSSVVERNHNTGLYVEGSQATFEASVIRATELSSSSADDPEVGRGVAAQPYMATGVPATLLLRSSLVEQSHQIGVFVVGSQATLEASAVRNTAPGAQGRGGRGVGAQPHPTTGAPSTLLVTTSLIEHNRDVGVLVAGSQATLEASVVRDTDVDLEGEDGRGVQVQSNDVTGAPATLHLWSSLIEQNHVAGVFIHDSDATIASCLLRDARPNGHDEFGHGVVVMSDSVPTSVSITATHVDQSALAALAAWGAHAALGGSKLTCQAFDINSETHATKPATLEDRGGNLCGCPQATASCKALSRGLQPPPSLELSAEP